MPKKVKSKKTSSAVEVEYPKKTDDTQEYGEVSKFFGGNWLLVKCADEKERRCHIRGTLQRQKSSATRINVGDFVLISKRDDDLTGDIIIKYPMEVARQLVKSGEIKIKRNQTSDGDDGGVIFEDEDKKTKNSEEDFENVFSQI